MSDKLQVQQDFIKYASDLREIAQKNDLGGDLTEKSVALEAAMRDCELVIPVVGLFSSGKSTMLNTLLGDHILPTAIKPETSLATELRYAEQPYLEAVAIDGTVTRYDAGDIKAVTNNAPAWDYVRLYLNNARLRDMEPLVLVDMPGFDAPLERHNRAIVSYLLRGCHYFVLCDIQEGTLSQTLLRHMHEIESYDRGISLFMSKTDLRPSSDVAAVMQHVRHLLDTEFDEPVALSGIDSRSVEAVTAAIASLRPDALFIRLFAANLSALCHDFLGTINIKLKASCKSREQLESILQELRDGVDGLKAKAEADIEHMRRTYSTGLTDDIVRSIGKDLSSACGELVNILENGSQTEAEARLNDIVRTSLQAAVKEKLGEITMQICKEFSTSLEGIDRILKQEQIDDAFIENISMKIQTAFNVLQDLLRNSGGKAAAVLSGLSKGGAVSVGSRAVGGGIVATSLLGSAASITMPVIGVLLLFLPEILGAFFKTSNNEKVRAALRGKLEGDIFPAIKRKLRETLPAQLENQVANMIETVREQYTAVINEKIEAVREAASKQEADRQAQEQEQHSLEAARNEVTAILNQLNSY